MEPNKWEKEIKEKLNKRTIQPGEMAWDRLDAMLSVAENKKKPKYKWMYVAAGFMGFVLAGTLFLNQQKEEIINNNTISTNAVVTSPETKEDSAASPVLNNTQNAPEVADNISNTVIQTKKPLAKKYSNTEKAKPVLTNIIPQNSIIAVADIKEIKPLKENMTPDQEAEMLLAETLTTEAPKKTVVKVSANSLLSEVEGELDNNFRSRVWQTVTKNYNVVKTTVANRNRE